MSAAQQCGFVGSKGFCQPSLNISYTVFTHFKNDAPNIMLNSHMSFLHNIKGLYTLDAGPSCRAVYGVGLRSLAS